MLALGMTEYTKQELKDLKRKEYKTFGRFKKNPIFRRTDLEVLLYYTELEARWNMDYKKARWDSDARQIIRYEIAHFLLKSKDGKFYRISVELDKNEEWENPYQKRYAVQEVNWLDILCIGGWKARDNDTDICIHRYESPKEEKAKVRFYINKNSITAKGLFTIKRFEGDRWLPATTNATFTSKYNRHNFKTEDLFEIADKHGLKRCYINNFEYWKSRE